MFMYAIFEIFNRYKYDIVFPFYTVLKIKNSKLTSKSVFYLKI